MDPGYPPKKKGLSSVAWLGIGCGGVTVLLVIFAVLIGLFFGPRIKEMMPQFEKIAATAQKNPARGGAEMMIAMGRGNFEMAEEDDAKQRYTVRDKKSGAHFTFYWDAPSHTVKSVKGDFSAIPADAGGAPH